MKICKICGILKPLSDYYKHPRMLDGHLGKCKECQKENSTAARNANLEKYREYDRKRGNNPNRVDARIAYALTDSGAEAILRAKGSYIARNPERRRANSAVSNSLRDGTLIKLPCQVCGKTAKIEGHHPLYSMLTDVIWLCKTHHQQLHNEHDEFTKTQNSNRIPG